MSDGKKISQLPEATSLEDGSLLPIVTDGQTEKATINQLREALGTDTDAYEVKQYDKSTSFPAKGEINKLYISMENNKIYRWDIVSLKYVEVSSSTSIVIDTALSETSTNAIANAIVAMKFKEIEERLSNVEVTEAEVAEINELLDEIESQV